VHDGGCAAALPSVVAELTPLYARGMVQVTNVDRHPIHVALAHMSPSARKDRSASTERR
jgi:hypothetical protein